VGIPATDSGDAQDGPAGSGGTAIFMIGLLLIVLSAFSGTRRRAR
jgi:hypothetical protein